MTEPTPCLLCLRGRPVASLVLGLVLVLVTAGCQPPEPTSTQSQRAMDRAQAVDAFLHAGPWFSGPQTLAVLRRLAPLKSERKVPLTTEFQNQTATDRRALEFDGLLLEGSVEGDTFQIQAISVTSPRWALGQGLNVGTPATRIPTALHQPHQVLQEPAESYSGEAGTVRFTLRDGLILKVDITLHF